MEIRSILVIAALLAVPAAVADEAWTWTDEDGVVHYSDVPRDGAEAVNLSEYNKKTGARISSNRTTQRQTEPETEEFGYSTLAIVAPEAEQTLWNIEGVLNVRVAVEPNLLQGHRLRVYYDGNAQDMLGTSFQLTEVYRGVHNLLVEVIDAQGVVVSRSEPVRFYVQQNTVGR